MGLGTREVTEISATGAVNMATQTRPMQFRLPRWAGDFIEQRAAMRGTSKTAVVLEAIECLENGARVQGCRYPTTGAHRSGDRVRA